jgi:hypothetical protein
LIIFKIKDEDTLWTGEWIYWPHVHTALSFYKSPQHPLSLFPVCYIFTSRSLATASNGGDSSASRPQVLSSQPPVQNWTLNWQLTGSSQLSSL